MGLLDDIKAKTGVDVSEGATEKTQLQEIADKEIAVEYKNGAKVSLSDYADMAGGYYVQQTEREAAVNRSNEIFSGDLVQIVGPIDKRSCDVCTRAVEAGTIYSLNGRTPGFPLLSEFESQGGFHPRCKHEAVTTEECIDVFHELQREGIVPSQNTHELYTKGQLGIEPGSDEVLGFAPGTTLEEARGQIQTNINQKFIRERIRRTGIVPYETELPYPGAKDIRATGMEIEGKKTISPPRPGGPPSPPAVEAIAKEESIAALEHSMQVEQTVIATGQAEWDLDELARHNQDITNLDQARALLEYESRQMAMLKPIQKMIDDFRNKPYSLEEAKAFLKEIIQ